MRGRQLARCIALVALVSLVACGTPDEVDNRDYDVSIDIDRQAGRSFTAHGDAVDEEVICPIGRAWSAGFTHLDGRPMTLDELAPLRSAAIDADPPDVTIGYLLEVELACSDGSGIVDLIVEERDSGGWEIVSGTGAYRSLNGAGTIEVERDPPTESWHPPGGVPHWNHLSGSVRRASG